MSPRRIDAGRLAGHSALMAISCLRDFATLVIAHVSSGGVLDDDALASIRDGCLREIKNADPAGLSIEEEAKILGKIVKDIEKLIDTAIREGRERKER